MWVSQVSQLCELSVLHNAFAARRGTWEGSVLAGALAAGEAFTSPEFKVMSLALEV